MLEKVVELKKCSNCSESFEITDKDLKFYKKVSPVFNGKKYLIPSPTFCPECRFKRRLSFRNERYLYRRKCDLSGKEILSMYSPKYKGKVIDSKIWRSDDFDGIKYGKDFDFEVSFFEQFNNLFLEVPTLALIQLNAENSDYINGGGYIKNCYLCFNIGESQDCFYCDGVSSGELLIDCTSIRNTTIGYDLIDCDNSYYLFHSIKCDDCRKSYYLYDCNNCEYCFMCVNLKNKKYCILNKQYTKEDYEIQKEKILKDIEKYLDKHKKLIKKTPKKSFCGYNNNDFSGNFCNNTKNCHNCFEVYDSENLKNCN